MTTHLSWRNSKSWWQQQNYQVSVEAAVRPQQIQSDPSDEIGRESRRGKSAGRNRAADHAGNASGGVSRGQGSPRVVCVVETGGEIFHKGEHAACWYQALSLIGLTCANVQSLFHYSSKSNTKLRVLATFDSSATMWGLCNGWPRLWFGAELSAINRIV
jgi:hypothetical protein